MLCFGHRGARGYAPENTLKSVKKAIDLGTPWIEVDVYYVDNELIIIHDEHLERTTNGTGYVMEKTFSDLRSLDAGEGEQIPTLSEVLDLLPVKSHLNIELKGPNTASPVLKTLLNYIGSDIDMNRFLISSFNHHEIKKIKLLDDRVKIAAIITGIPIQYAAFAEELNAFAVVQNIECINEAFVQDAHDRGLKVFVFTVNQIEDLKRMDRLGVDGVYTDYPDRVLSLFPVQIT